MTIHCGMDVEVNEEVGGGKKVLYVHNLGSNVTIQDLAKAFSLETPNEQCNITLQAEERDEQYFNFAKIVVPSEVALKVSQLDGTELLGRRVRITESADVPNTALLGGETSMGSTADGTDTGGTAERESRSYVELDLSAGFDCYRIKTVTRAELVHAIEKKFDADDTKRVIAPVRRDDTLWRIETEKINLYESADSLSNDNNELIATVNIRKQYSHRTPEGRVFWSKKETPPRGQRQSGGNELLITLYEANTDKFRHVTNDMLTLEIVKMGAGEIKKSVRPQPACPGSAVPGKNKYFVLQNVDKSKISPFFVFYDNETDTNVRLYLNYFGKPRRCNFCGESHDGECELKQKIRALEEERRAATAPTGKLPIKTYSDSTLRYAREQALSSDVDAMSGGAMGNILNAMEVDQGVVDNVILVAGTNELHRRMEVEEFVLVMENTAKRITEIGKSRKLAILPPPEHTNTDTLEQAKSLAETLEKVNDGGVTVLKNPIDSYDEDWGKHPTREQTVALINFLDEQAKILFDVPLKLESATDDVLCAPRFYKGITPLYRFGCSGCNDRTKNKWQNLCDACRQTAFEDPDILSKAGGIRNREKQIYELANPQMVGVGDSKSGGSDDQLSDGGDLTCPFCSIAMENSVAFNQHFKVHHPEEKIKSVRDKCKYVQNGDN